MMFGNKIEARIYYLLDCFKDMYYIFTGDQRNNVSHEISNMLGR